MKYYLVPKKKLFDLIMDAHELRVFEKTGIREFINSDIDSYIKYEEKESEYIKDILEGYGEKVDNPSHYNFYDIAEHEAKQYNILEINNSKLIDE
ncbi:MAG: hypothetical protein [Caudoviricetes sp.]|nr:MAG: hypothetical protein [Caudoviricetes sp.]